MAKEKLSDIDKIVVNCLSRNELLAMKDIVKRTGLTHSEVNNAIINLTSKAPIYEDVVKGVAVYGLL